MATRIRDDQTYDQIPFCPVLHPSAKEFSDFNTYILKLEEEYSHTHGMVKIIPPAGWKAREQDYEKSLDDQMIKGPIEQNPYGKGGFYECIHITKKSMPFREYKKRSRVFDKVTEGKSVAQVEEMFWKNISFSPPLYGSDMQMTLFDKGVEWNLNELHSVLNDGLEQKIQGVNTPYLYIGSWKTLFAWHKEDLDLGAINYLHYGKPKFWYCMSSKSSSNLERLAQQSFSESYAKCPEFLRHKTTVINPYQLIKSIPVEERQITKTAQQPGEFVIVFNGAYHHGFNWGYNIAEAVNYASIGWLDHFMNSKLCHCSADNVNIDHKQFFDRLLRLRPEFSSTPEIASFNQFLKEKKKEAMEAEKIHEEQSCSVAQKTLKKRGRKPKASVISSAFDGDNSMQPDHTNTTDEVEVSIEDASIDLPKVNKSIAKLKNQVSLKQIFRKKKATNA